MLGIFNAIWVVGWVTVIFGPPITFGLYYVSSELVHGRDAGLSGLVSQARRYFWQSWLWGLPNLLLMVMVAIEAPFLQRYPVYVPFIGVVVAVWLTVQFYALPYFQEQESKNMLVAWRNGLFTALASPFYTLIVIGF